MNKSVSHISVKKEACEQLENKHGDWFVLRFLLATLTIQLSLEHK